MNYKRLFVVVIVTLLATLIVSQTETFQQCFHAKKNEKRYQVLRERRSILDDAIKRLGTRAQISYVCTWSFTEKNNGAIIALATIALSAFTFTLWRSTDKLWRTTEGHSRHLEESVGVARQSAGAAITAAKAAEKGNRINQQIYAANQRPWVSFEVTVGGPLRYDVNGMNVTLDFTVRNVGRTPALYVFPAPSLHLRREGHRDDLAVQQRLCAQERERPVSQREIGVTVFPGQVVTLPHMIISVSKEEVIAGTLPRTKWLVPIIVGCINYQSAFEEIRHQTRFIYWLNKRDRSQVIEEDGNIPADNLILVPRYVGGGAFYVD